MILTYKSYSQVYLLIICLVLFADLQAGKKGVSQTVIGLIFSSFELGIFVSAPLYGLFVSTIFVCLRFVSNAFAENSNLYLGWNIIICLLLECGEFRLVELLVFMGKLLPLAFVWKTICVNNLFGWFVFKQQFIIS